MLEIRNVSFSYKQKNILNHINLTIPQGSCTGILGANGCGKSTLLSILAGAIRPDHGQLLYLGKEIKPSKGQLACITGYVPQDNPLIPELSVLDNLKLWFHGDRKAFHKELSEGFLQLMGVNDFLKMPISKLSGGMKRRVSIGLALQNHPPLLILDEPTAALDLLCKADIRSSLTVYLQNGGTILLTTHDESELDLCSSLYVLKQGLLYQIPTSTRGNELIQSIKNETNGGILNESGRRIKDNTHA